MTRDSRRFNARMILHDRLDHKIGLTSEKSTSAENAAQRNAPRRGARYYSLGRNRRGTAAAGQIYFPTDRIPATRGRKGKGDEGKGNRGPVRQNLERPFVTTKDEVKHLEAQRGQEVVIVAHVSTV